MIQLQTVFSSNTPIDCHLVKGRLETEGIPCFIFDEHTIAVHPFRAVALGGVKLKVSYDRLEQAQHILTLINHGLLEDEEGEYPLAAVFETEFKRQNEVLALKHKIRCDSQWLNRAADVRSSYLDSAYIAEIMQQEREYLECAQKKCTFTLVQFLIELFDLQKDIFGYLRVRPPYHYIEKEMVDRFIKRPAQDTVYRCTACGSENVYFGHAIGQRWDLAYLIISLLLMSPLFPLSKRCHCFDCGCNFRRSMSNRSVVHQ